MMESLRILQTGLMTVLNNLIIYDQTRWFIKKGSNRISPLIDRL